MKKCSFKILATILSLMIVVSSFLPIGIVSAENNETSLSTNLISGKLPTDFYRAVIGSPQDFNYGVTSVAYGPSGLNPYSYNWTDYKEAFAPYLATATDDDAEAGNAYNLGQSFVLIYELDEVSQIDEFAINIGTHAENANSAIVKVYTAEERSAIFSADPTATLNIDWAAGSSTELDVKAKFVAVVIEATTGTTKDYFAIRNIAVNKNEEAPATTTSVNLISGKLPTDFYRAVIGSPQDFNYGVTSVAYGPSGLNPYSYNWTDYKEAFAPYLATATDDDAEAGNAYNLGQSFVLIYELDEVSQIDEFAIKIGTHAENANSAVVKVYTATERSAIFSADPTATLNIDWSAGSSATLNVTAKYVAVVIEATTGTTKDYFAIRDIAVNSIVADDGSDEEDATPDVNLLSGLIPVAGYPVNDGTTTFSYAMIRTRNASDAWISTRYGYSSVPEECPDAEFASAMALFTDGNVSTSKYLANERKDYEDVLIAYKLKKLSVINSITLDSGSSIPRGTKVYLSTSYDTLFNAENLAGTYTYNEANNKFEIELAEPKQAEYVGFVFDNSYSNHMTIAEIGAWGYECEYTNVLSGLVPVAGYPVEDGTTKFSYRIIKTRDANNNWISYVENGVTLSGIRYGYGHRPEICPSDAYTSAMALFTDGKIETSRHLSNEAHQTDDVLIVYQLDKLSYINSITLDSGSEIPRGTKVYLSTSYASLFNSANLVGTYTYDETKNNFEINLDEDKQALYVGFVFDNAYGKHMTIAEVAAWGKDYPASNYNSVLSGEMVNPTTNEETKNFYGYLKNTGESESVLLAAQINIDEYSDITKRALNDNYYEYIQKTYNVSPAIVGTQWKLDVSYYKDYYDEGSIPLISIPGASSPTVDALASHEGYIKYYDAEYIPSADEEDLYYTVQEEIEDCYRDQLDFFQELEAAGVKTYIVRPFIEMNHNDLFGTSYNNQLDHFKNVWKQTVEYFEDKGLEGIIWAFSPVTTERWKYDPAMSYYPGNEYVDIIAPTCYSGTNDGVLPEIIGYDEMIATGKPFALSEVGVIDSYDITTRTDCMNLLNSLKTTYAEAAFVNLWYGENFGISVHENAEQFINDEYIIGVDEMQKYQYGHIGNVPVELYTSADYSGDCTAALLGEHSDITTYNSIKIDDGYMITFIDNASDKWYFGKDIADLASLDVANVASIKIEKTEAYTVYDINNDGEKDITDLVRLKKYMVGIAPETNPLSADIDTNGKVNATDLSSMRKWLLNNF